MSTVPRLVVYSSNGFRVPPKANRVMKILKDYETKRLNRITDVYNYLKKKHDYEVQSIKDISREFMNFDIGEPEIDEVEIVDVEEEHDEFFEN